MTVFVLLGAVGAGRPANATCDPIGAPLECAAEPTPPLTTPVPGAQPNAAPAPAPAPAPPQPAKAPEVSGSDDQPRDGLTAQDAAALLLNLVNRERVAAGRPPLTSRDDLVRVAAAHSAGMAQRGQIFHNDLLFTAQVKSRLGARSVGENVAVNASAEDAHRRLMASPGHRANILNSQFRLAGIAVVNRAGSWYVTETFVSPVAGGVGQQGAARQRTPVGATSDDRLGTEPVAPAPTMAAAPTSTQDSTPSTIAPPRRAHTSGGVPFLTVLFAMVLVGLTTRGAGRELRRVLAPTAAHASSGPQPGLRATMPVGFLQY